MKEAETMTINGMDERAFLNKYCHDDIRSVADIGLDWDALVDMYNHYCTYVRNDLELKAAKLHEELRHVKGAYIVKYRVKDPEHLIDKVIRKKKDNQKLITKENYLKEIDDFIGLRILHLFKNDWEEISKAVMEHYVLKEAPVCYHRKGDDEKYLKRCEELGITPKEKEAGYRSIHFIAKVPFFGAEFKCEIQVRTIFEEAWSEIDHLVRYPNNKDNELLNNYLLMFNKLSGYADEVGTFLMAMKSNMAQQQTKQAELEGVVSELRGEIKKLQGSNAQQSKKIYELMERLDKSVQLTWPTVPEFNFPSTLDYISQIQNPSGYGFSNPFLAMQESIEDILSKTSMKNLHDAFASPAKAFTMPKVGSPLPDFNEIYHGWLRKKK